MHIHHIALWTTRLEELKDFYITYFKGTGNEKYINPLKGSNRNYAQNRCYFSGR